MKTVMLMYVLFSSFPRYQPDCTWRRVTQTFWPNRCANLGAHGPQALQPSFRVFLIARVCTNLPDKARDFSVGASRGQMSRGSNLQRCKSVRVLLFQTQARGGHGAARWLVRGRKARARAAFGLHAHACARASVLVCRMQAVAGYQQASRMLCRVDPCGRLGLLFRRRVGPLFFRAGGREPSLARESWW